MLKWIEQVTGGHVAPQPEVVTTEPHEVRHLVEQADLSE
jgi:hypothetical protein